MRIMQKKLKDDDQDLAAVLMFNVQKSYTGYDQHAKEYKGFSRKGNQMHYYGNKIFNSHAYMLIFIQI